MWVRIVGGLLLVLALAYVAATTGPGSLRARYRADVAKGLARGAIADTLTEADLAPLPPAVSRYLRLTGAVGQPRVRNYRVHFRGRIRSAADAPWMPLDAEQTSFVDPGERLFYLEASMMGLPVKGLHRYIGPHATMNIKLAGAFTVAAAAGPVMDVAETVTLFNDMCILAPSTLIDPTIRWAEVDAHRVHGTFTNAGHTIGADLVFDDAGELVDFVSDDRTGASADGRTFTHMRWNTPVRDYRAFGAHRLAGRGECRWHAPKGEFVYLEIEMLDVTYNIAAP
jgi:hypothetical protein